ncbi:MAG: gliding motility-associated protein GldE [Pseudopedobacter saltans]|uniref:Gliding motility-associated protein GldE n=1 Tax=Pseudopedobacter saltans TaxID=151895 RepID=A0A2W5FBR5_9SPHI|nr:MAG: gliding motility-associated protein GldE [Pseudopedobacter saltans]
MILTLLASNTINIPATSELTVLAIAFVVILLFLFIVSGAQVAYFALDNNDINLLKTKELPSYKRILELLDTDRLFFSSLQVAYFFFVLLLVILGNMMFNTFTLPPMPEYAVWLIKIAALFIILLIFGELLPKLYAAQNPIRFAKDFSLFAVGFYYVFGRIGSWVYKASFSVEAVLFPQKSKAQYNQDMDEAIDKSTIGGDASDEEKMILKGIVKFSNIYVKQIMTPRLDVNGIEFNISFQELISKIEDLHYHRLPVYKNNLDSIVGVINTNDVLPHLDNPNFDWHALIVPALFVHEHKLIESLLYDFQSSKNHLAFIVDEFGGTSGLVTLYDIQEEIIGEIKDEFDQEEGRFQKIDDHNFILDGRLMLIDACRIMGIPSATFDDIKGDNDSVAGLVLAIAKSFPNINDQLEYKGFMFTVLEKRQNRLEKIQVTIAQTKE